MQGALQSQRVLGAPTARSLRPTSRVVARGLTLDKPERLWEAGGTIALPYASPPEYLDGSLPGDRGFDPLRLATIRPGPISEDKDSLNWMAESELYHGRIAMTAVAGILTQEALGKGPWWDFPSKPHSLPVLPAVQYDLAPGIPATRGLVPHIWQCTVGQGTCPTEAYSGSQPFPEHGFTNAPGVDKYWAVVAVAHVAFAWLELQRYKNFRSKGETGFAKFAPFDPLGQRNDRNRQAEVRNGRLAMLATLGFAVQAYTTGTQPLEGLQNHIANPTSYNILNNARGTFTVLLAGVVGLGLVEASRGKAQKAVSAVESAVPEPPAQDKAE